jgi:hypothetical protein
MRSDETGNTVRLIRVGSLCVGSFQFASVMYVPASESWMLFSDSSLMRSTNEPSASK